VGNRVRNLAGDGNVADHCMSVWKLLLEGTDTIRRARQSDHAKSSARETPDNRGTGAGADTRDNGNRLVSHELCLAIA
jgi:hypothetical protein